MSFFGSLIDEDGQANRLMTYLISFFFSFSFRFVIRFQRRDPQSFLRDWFRPTAIKLSPPFRKQNGGGYYDVPVFVLLARNSLPGASTEPQLLFL